MKIAMPLTETLTQALAEVIGGIGEADFAATAAGALCRFMDFDVAAVVLHGGGGPRLMFDSFDAVDGRDGLDAYLRHTYAVNPMVCGRAWGAVRARDFASRRAPAVLRSPYLVASPDEELGFRTVGWPRGLEEIGLYFEACGGLVELGLYRPRGRHPVAAERMYALDRLTVPVAAAFEAHRRAGGRTPSGVSFAVLSPREREVAGLLVQGCTSEAIALRLDISHHTVRDHRKHIFRKLGITSLAELFALT